MPKETITAEGLSIITAEEFAELAEKDPAYLRGEVWLHEYGPENALTIATEKFYNELEIRGGSEAQAFLFENSQYNSAMRQLWENLPHYEEDAPVTVDVIVQKSEDYNPNLPTIELVGMGNADAGVFYQIDGDKPLILTSRAHITTMTSMF
jgi:hypothetical protein